MEAIRNMGDVIFDNPELGSQRHPGKFQPGFPEALRPYDTNKDGKLTTNEIKPVIDRYLSSQTEFSSREMVRFIDYFFSQFWIIRETGTRTIGHHRLCRRPGPLRRIRDAGAPPRARAAQGLPDHGILQRAAVPRGGASPPLARARLLYLPFRANGVQSIVYDIVSILHALCYADRLLILGVSGCILLPFVRLFTNKRSL